MLTSQSESASWESFQTQMLYETFENLLKKRLSDGGPRSVPPNFGGYKRQISAESNSRNGFLKFFQFFDIKNIWKNSKIFVFWKFNRYKSISIIGSILTVENQMICQFKWANRLQKGPVIFHSMDHLHQWTVRCQVRVQVLDQNQVQDRFKIGSRKRSRNYSNDRTNRILANKNSIIHS